jgi:hypothetical protein
MEQRPRWHQRSSPQFVRRPYKAWYSSRSVGLEVRALLFTWLIRYYAQSGRKQQRFPFHLAIADCPLISRVLSVCGWVKPQSTTRISW